MRIFAIRDEELHDQNILAYLLYYEQAKSFYIELPDDADLWATPLLLSAANIPSMPTGAECGFSSA